MGSAAAGHAQPAAGPGGATSQQQINRHELLIGEQDWLVEHHPAPLALQHHADRIDAGRAALHVLEQGAAGLLKHLLAFDAVEAQGGGGSFQSPPDQEGGAGGGSPGLAFRRLGVVNGGGDVGDGLTNSNCPSD